MGFARFEGVAMASRSINATVLHRPLVHREHCAAITRGGHRRGGLTANWSGGCQQVPDRNEESRSVQGASGDSKSASRGLA